MDNEVDDEFNFLFDDSYQPNSAKNTSAKNTSIQHARVDWSTIILTLAFLLWALFGLG